MKEILSLDETIASLDYIAKSPPREHGGFHTNAVLVAESAIHHLSSRAVMEERNHVQALTNAFGELGQD